MTSFGLAMFLQTLQNLSLSLNTLFWLLLMTKKHHIIHLCLNKLIGTMNFCSYWLKSSPKTLKARSETQYTTPEQYTPKQPTTTTVKLNNVLKSRTFHDLTYKLDPYKTNPSDSPHTTLTHILDCYDNTLKILQTLDSQRITQSSKATQTTLENINIVFRFLIPNNTSPVNFFSACGTLHPLYR